MSMSLEELRAKFGVMPEEARLENAHQAVGELAMDTEALTKVAQIIRSISKEQLLNKEVTASEVEVIGDSAMLGTAVAAEVLELLATKNMNQMAFTTFLSYILQGLTISQMCAGSLATLGVSDMVLHKELANVKKALLSLKLVQAIGMNEEDMVDLIKQSGKDAIKEMVANYKMEETTNGQA